jgi:hypothetical protein
MNTAARADALIAESLRQRARAERAEDIANDLYHALQSFIAVADIEIEGRSLDWHLAEVYKTARAAISKAAQFTEE